MTRAVPKRSKRHLPLWQKLMFALVPSMMVLLGGGLWLSLHNLTEIADSAYDRSLNGAIRAIEMNVTENSGGIGVAQPFLLLEALRATAEGEFFFRVSTDDNLVEIGDALLPEPPPLEIGKTVFFDAVYLGRPVRVGAYMRPLTVALYGKDVPQNLIIEVAETLGSRQAFSQEIVFNTIWRDIFTIIVAGLVLVIGVLMALRPLYTLRTQIDRWQPNERQSLDESSLPPEVHPLAQALNRLVQRQNVEAELQRRFIDDASHQLKTPIAVLRSQADFANRSPDPMAAKTTVAAMLPVIDRMGRMTGQLLALARARSAASRLRSGDTLIDLRLLLEEVLKLHLGQARRRSITPSLELPDQPIQIIGNEAFFFEAISNLVENALHATPPGGRIFLSAQREGDQVVISLQDEGPGMTAADIALAGERFRTANELKDTSSTGLGLSIAMAIVKAHGGALRLINRPEGGLEARVTLSVKLIPN